LKVTPPECCLQAVFTISASRFSGQAVSSIFLNAAGRSDFGIDCQLDSLAIFFADAIRQANEIITAAKK